MTIIIKDTEISADSVRWWWGPRMVQQDAISASVSSDPGISEANLRIKTVDCETKAEQYCAKKRQLYQQVHQHILYNYSLLCEDGLTQDMWRDNFCFLLESLAQCFTCGSSTPMTRSRDKLASLSRVSHDRRGTTESLAGLKLKSAATRTFVK